MFIRRKIDVINKFEHFQPQEKDFEIVQEEVPPIEINEFLVKTEYLSVDPYMRSFHDRRQPPYTQFSFQVGKVIESKNPNFPVDSHVVSHSQWADYVVLDNEFDKVFHMKPYIPNLDKLPVSYSLGALGMPGIAAYLGFTQLCKPKSGDIFCVTSAAGAVGSIVGQLAKLQGCIVIGFTGSDEKAIYLKRDLEFDYAYNYKTEKHIRKKLENVAPNGIDVYFDNVGGNLSQKIMEKMCDSGKVIVCGTISTYGGKHINKESKTPLEISTFSFTQWDWNMQKSAMESMKELVLNGNIKVNETITEGFENTPKALIGMLGGENIGKALVKI